MTSARLVSAMTLVMVLSACGDTIYISLPSADGSVGDGGRFGDGGVGGDAGYTGPFPDLDAGELAAGVCADQGKQIVASQVDLLVVLDVSYSMDYDHKWEAVRSAMNSFVTKPQFSGLGIGLQYFPIRAQCSVAEYEKPAVPFSVLPLAAGAISSSLSLQQMQGGTPTVPVLEGTSKYARTWETAHPDHQTVIVLATDGVPDDSCVAAPDGGLANSLPNVLTVASGALHASPPIKTFVIGVGKDLTALNQIAAAGGTQKALLVDTRYDADIAFLDALTEVKNAALGCDFDVPFKNGVDPSAARVRFIADDPRRSFVVPKVADAASCKTGSGAGWYFEGLPPETKLALCRPSCEALNGPTGKLYVEFGCAIQ